MSSSATRPSPKRDNNSSGLPSAPVMTGWPIVLRVSTVRKKRLQLGGDLLGWRLARLIGDALPLEWARQRVQARLTIPAELHVPGIGLATDGANDVFCHHLPPYGRSAPKSTRKLVSSVPSATPSRM